jgi:hypothetical protein
MSFPLGNFSEDRNISYYADYRVFIFGVDVTEFVTGNLTWTLTDRDGPGTAGFNLQNAFDNFVLTEDNLKNKKFREPKDLSYMYSERAKKELLSAKQQIQTGTIKPFYPLGIRNVILHRNDPLRIFIQNPISLTEWYNVFTGYLDSVGKTTNYINGESSLSIKCYDIRSLMQKMRVQMSPVHGTNEVYQVLMNDPHSFFADMLDPTTNNHPFAELSYEKAIEVLILGRGIENGGIQGGSIQGSFATKRQSTGIGRFSKGESHYFDSAANDSTKKDILNKWYNLCLYGAKGSALTYAEVLKIGAGTKPLGDYAPDNQKYYMLLPKEGTQTSSLTTFHFSQGVEQKDFSNRWDIITDFSEKIDYQWWVTGNGDIVFEFPMYEFEPADFKYSSIMTVDKLTIDDSITDEEGDIPSVLTATGGGISNRDNFELNLQEANIPRVIVANPAIAARFGIKNEEHTFPTVLNFNSLQLLAQIEYWKRLSSSSSLDVNFAWKPWLLPNKPLYHKYEERMGITTAVTQTLTLFDTCSTSATLRYIRRRDLNGKFTFIDGAESVVASYKNAWAGATGVTKTTGTVLISNGTATTVK